jgi:hypothetical protein
VLRTPFAGVLLRELLLRCCFGPPNLDVGVAVVVGVVVAWTFSVTDVTLAPPRAIAAERVMPPRGCFGAWASVAFSVASSPPRLHLLSWLHCVVLVEGPVSHFLAVSLCLSLLGSQLCGL